MTSEASILFFEKQFQRQVHDADCRLNPFEQAALPLLRGRVLDYGCGLGNLAIAAARPGCTVVALDGSHTAVAHLRDAAHREALPIDAQEADLRTHMPEGEFDCVVSIGLLMFFDCATAFEQLRRLQSHVRPGGVAVVNVLVEGTTFLDMFDPSEHCLFARDALEQRFAGWDILQSQFQDFSAPHGQVKAFVTVVARKPA
jgi:tellurite methyltransferase